MRVHPNARTTPQLRLQLVTRVAEGEPVEEDLPVWRAGYLVSLDFGHSQPVD